MVQGACLGPRIREFLFCSLNSVEPEQQNVFGLNWVQSAVPPH